MWVARLPALKHKLSLDSGRLGLVIFAVTAVATLSLPLAGWLASRRGSRGPAGAGLVLASGALAAAAFVPSFAPMLLVACGLGSGIGVADVSLNAHGIELERRTGRHLLSPLHAAWSFGLLGGSAVRRGRWRRLSGHSGRSPDVSLGAPPPSPPSVDAMSWGINRSLKPAMNPTAM